VAVFSCAAPSGVPTCPSGYQYDGQHCVKTYSTPARLRCPEGYDVAVSNEKGLGNKCVMSDSKFPQARCDMGFILQDGQCQRTDIMSPSFTCSKGYIVRGGECVSVEESYCNKQCPETYQLTGEFCMRQLVQAPAVECPKGFEVSGNKCVKRKIVDPIRSCPKGYTFKEADNIKDEKNKPVGKKKGDEHAEKKEETAKSTGKKGEKKNRQLTAVEGKCERLSIIPADTVCPEGYDLR
jgi:hypothetical protein